MENKTIGELNKRAWYRFLKSVFIISLLLVLGVFNLIAFYTNGGIKQIDPSQTTIQCNLGTKTSFTAQSIELSLNGSDFPNGQLNYKGFFVGYNDYTIGKILRACYPKKYENQGSYTPDIYDFQKQSELINKYGFVDNSSNLTQQQSDTIANDYNTNYQPQTKNLYGNAKVQYLDFSFHMFDVTPTFTYSNFLWLFIIGNVIILLIFEAIRRVFYYIVLGSLSPEK